MTSITNVAVFVVRYFGGIKPGTGGLVKAYGEAAKGVLHLLPVEELIDRKKFTLGLSYAAYEGAAMKIRSRRGRILDESFGTGVSLTGEIPADEAEALTQEIADLTAGRGKFFWSDGETANHPPPSPGTRARRVIGFSPVLR